MSKFVKLFAALALMLSAVAFVPGSAEARWGGWHGGGWHGGGWHGGWGGWRGPAFGWGFGPRWGWGPGWGWGNPYLYASGPSCTWVPVRFWRNGYWVVRRGWRCW